MKILVPLDGSPTAEAAVPIALRLAHAENAGVVLLTVTAVHPMPDPVPAEVDLVPIRTAEAYLDSVKHRLAGDYPNVSTAVWRGTPAAAIVRVAQEYKVDEIVMTTHGRTGAERDMFGSVADAVLRAAPIPILVLRPRRDAVRVPPGDAEPVTTARR